MQILDMWEKNFRSPCTYTIDESRVVTICTHMLRKKGARTVIYTRKLHPCMSFRGWSLIIVCVQRSGYDQLLLTYSVHCSNLLTPLTLALYIVVLAGCMHAYMSLD